MNEPVETWRFIESGFCDGLTNMAVDEAMARVADNSDMAATLRTYGWRPFAISLGFHQSFDEIDIDRCRRDGVDVVRRPTGGRAILHAQELTYSVIIPKDSRFFDKSITKVYGVISRAIVAGLNHLDVGVQFEGASSTPKDFAKGDLAALCFATSIQHEIGWEGRKLVGSAQRRVGNTVLQHGSILIGREHLRLVDYLTVDMNNRRQAALRHLKAKTVCLNDFADFTVTFSDVQNALCYGFQTELGISLKPATINLAETRLVDSLLKARRNQ